MALLFRQGVVDGSATSTAQPFGSREIELADRIDEIVVYGDEDGGAELDGLGGEVVGVYGGCAAAYVRVAFIYCDVEGDAGVEGRVAEVVCC